MKIFTDANAIDFDTCDFNLVSQILSYLLPCWIRRSSSLAGYHIITRSKYGIVFDDPNRAKLREVGFPMVFFGTRGKQESGSWEYLENLNEFLEVQV